MRGSILEGIGRFRYRNRHERINSRAVGLITVKRRGCPEVDI